MNNAYPEKQLLSYVKTSVEMAAVIAAIKSLQANVEIKRMAYIMFRNESGNGKSGVNNNYCGFQADSGRWATVYDKLIDGVVKKVENGTGKERLFLAFKDVSGCLSMLFDRVAGRGLYIGGITHKVWLNHYVKDAEDLSIAYQREWVKGNKDYVPTDLEKANFISMYNQAQKLFS